MICSAGLGAEINNDYIRGFVSSSNRKELKPHLKALFADESLVNRSMIDDLLKYKRLDGVQDFLETLSTNLFADGEQSAAISGGLSDLSCPIQVIWGEKDEVIPQSHATTVAGANVTVIENAGHMVQMENASRVNDLIKAVL